MQCRRAGDIAVLTLDNPALADDVVLATRSACFCLPFLAKRPPVFPRR